MSENKSDWIKNRQSIIWEPELLISGIVLIGLLQVPQLIDRFTQYLNDWGPSIFHLSNIDEVLAAFLKTSVTFLIFGLIINLFLRSIWVVMVGMSYLFPEGYDLKKFNFQPYFRKKFDEINRFDNRVIQLDRICSFTYSITFFAFMCVIGLFFYLLVVGGFFITLYSLSPIHNDFTEVLLNTVLDLFLKIFGGIYLLDFITLGWVKRVKWLSRIYRPIYVLMSYLTLAPLYRNIYYGLLSKFNRWKVFTFLIAFIGLIYYLLLLQMGDEVVFNQSKMISQEMGIATNDGYYRDKNPAKINDWTHIPSAKVNEDVLEVFVAHKAVTEDSLLFAFEKMSGMNRDQVLSNDSLKLEAMSQFYRFRLDGQDLPTLSYSMFDYSQYRQKGLLGFIPLDSVSKGTHSLELLLNQSKPIKTAHLVFYKTKDGQSLKNNMISDENF